MENVTFAWFNGSHYILLQNFKLLLIVVLALAYLFMAGLFDIRLHHASHGCTLISQNGSENKDQ